MTSERIQRRIDALLDEAEEAAGAGAWDRLSELAGRVLTLDPSNVDAVALLAAAERGINSSASGATPSSAPQVEPSAAATSPTPTSFTNGRYVVKRFLGEGGKKKVYLAHDSLLDRDVAFALIKTEGLDAAGRVRVSREAQAMGRLGNHPNIVTVYDIGEENGQPYLVLPILSGGDVEGVIEKAPEHKLPLDRALKIAIETCQGLELAHGKGIVHRDLKPGNVWLTEDGRAMIGDFGLAVAADRSRLTQAGMMVGTVSYMPPEQAMGGEVGPRSDLYSLGAMLYEMVCGRPPFVGDESVAIIGQHLNTPPVAPTWHRPDCPPALEALILRLLQKDPEKRPASATEVREALESVNTGTTRPRDPTMATVAPSGDNPLYRRTFVGRENEVKQLQGAFDAALSGQGGLVMVVGEPGIGKTALCEQLATYVALRGGKGLVGHCYEEGSLSLPYLAFVEAMRSYVLAREPDGLRSDLGTGAADIARIVSEVRDRVQGVELRPNGDPEDDRWRLLQAITSFLRNASTVQALVIVLEDLHWADRGTLDLLLHVSRSLQGARLLIVGTYRDVEVDRSHPLSGVLADLRRGANFSRVPLRGLTVAEVHRMYEAIRGQEVPWTQAELVYRQTEGHPLFVQEVLRYLVEEGIVVREDGRYQVRPGDQASEAVIPEGLRDVVGKRLSHLSERTNQALSLAAVVGRDFRLDVLNQVLALSEDDLYSALEEAQERAIIEQRALAGTVGFRFTHAFFRQTLYEEIFTPRRIRMHQQVGRALEQIHGRRLDEHAAELAEHFSQSTEDTDLGKAVSYARMAAARATSVFDYGEALVRLQQAIKAQDVLDPEDARTRCDILTDMGEALLALDERMRAITEVLPEAIGLAESLQDEPRAFHVCRIALDSLIGTPTPLREVWRARAEAHVGNDPRAKLRVMRSRGGYLNTDGYAVSGVEVLREALLLARDLGDANEEAGTSWSALITGALSPEEEDDIVSRTSELALGGVSSFNRLSLLMNTAMIHLTRGHRARAEDVARQMRDSAEATKHVRGMGYGAHMVAMLALLDGQLERSLSALEESHEPQRARPQRLVINSWLGRPLAPTLASLGRNFISAGPEIVTLALAGDVSTAREHFSDLYQRFTDESSRLGPMNTVILLDLAVCLRDKEATGAIYEFLGKSHLSCRLYFVNPTTPSLDLLLGKAAASLGRVMEAKSHFHAAIAFSEGLPDRPELALTRLEMAELLLEHYPDERDAAIEHLDFAITELRDMKMQPALERALRHRGLLKA